MKERKLDSGGSPNIDKRTEYRFLTQSERIPTRIPKRKFLITNNLKIYIFIVLDVY
jgi:hypothetical protein